MAKTSTIAHNRTKRGLKGVDNGLRKNTTQKIKVAGNTLKTLKKPKTLSWWKKKLDKIFSQYIRLKYSTNGICECFTCKMRDNWKNLQNGHFIPRNISNTRFDETNNHPQCRGCNIFKSGNMDAYAVELEAKYGQGILQELADKKRVHKKFTIPELEEMCEHYKEKLLSLGLSDGRTSKT